MTGAAEPFTRLVVDATGPVGRLRLNRPERLNALDPTTFEELVRAAQLFDAAPDVRVVVVSGAGRAFCAGFDLTALADARRTPRETADLGRLLAEAVTGMRAVTVAAVQGACIGGGVVLVSCCDLRVAAADARFALPEAALGIPLGWGGVPRLVREIGPAATKDLVLTCREVDAEEAHRLGLLNRVVPPADLGAAADELAHLVASRPAAVLTATKRQVNAVAEELASTAGAAGDADLLLTSLADPEAAAARSRYLSTRRVTYP
ncbi:MAG: enoyl-CoA hydratase/isomerase family protein [Actinomycetia bacterium]|nr:enoyl-CoA hydratase/isomerase family protein [Actinomycetes bacterium]